MVETIDIPPRSFLAGLAWLGTCLAWDMLWSLGFATFLNCNPFTTGRLVTKAGRHGGWSGGCLMSRERGVPLHTLEICLQHGSDRDATDQQPLLHSVLPSPHSTCAMPVGVMKGRCRHEYLTLVTFVAACCRMNPQIMDEDSDDEDADARTY